MTLKDRIAARVRDLHPMSKVATVAFVEVGVPELERFALASVYDHAFSASAFEHEGCPVVLTNGFVSSHLYNIALAVRGHAGAPEAMATALRFNFKKFLAECVLGDANVQAGRGLLIETLLAEERDQKPLYDRLAREPDLVRFAEDAARLMGTLTSGHELGHVFYRRQDGFAEEVLGFWDGAGAGPIRDASDPGLREELVCDRFALWQMIEGEGPFDRATRVALARVAFQTVAEFARLALSAALTCEGAVRAERMIRLGSHRAPDTATDVVLLRGGPAHARADVAVALCEVLEPGAGAEVPVTEAAETILDDPWADTGVSRTRQIARLMAESLARHPDGVAHLMWRSKTFSFGPDVTEPA